MADRNLAHLHPDFALKVQKVLDGWKAWCDKHAPGYTPVLTDGFRSTAEQKALYAQGRTKPGDIVTNCDGVKNRSGHQSSLACDITLAKNGVPTWDDLPDGALDYYGHLARANGLDWGGDWHSIVDRPHIEWPTRDKKKYADARAWQARVGLR